jgi:hypothetical protein
MIDAKYKIIYAQPYVSGKSLMQDQILMIQMPNGSVNSSENKVALISNIWEDLQKSNGTYIVKHAKGDSWYWDDDKLVVTDTETEKNIKFKVQIPFPDKTIFENLNNESEDTEWACYWKNKLNKK